MQSPTHYVPGTSTLSLAAYTLCTNVVASLLVVDDRGMNERMKGRVPYRITLTIKSQSGIMLQIIEMYPTPYVCKFMRSFAKLRFRTSVHSTSRKYPTETLP